MFRGLTNSTAAANRGSPSSVNTSTRTFSWTPSVPQCGSGTFYWVKFVVTTPSGGTDAILCRITVTSGNGPDPESQTAAIGEGPNGLIIGPNPTRGEFVFPAMSRALGARSVIVFDLAGRRIASLRSLAQKPLKWDGRDVSGNRVSPGVYLYRLEEGPQRKIGRIVVVR